MPKGIQGFQKGYPVFNTGRTRFKKGHEMPEEMKRKIGNSLKGEKSYAWKGDDVSYSGLHKWINRELGSPQKCEHCGATAKGGRVQWANKDHKYKRNLIDWISLCAFCHRKYDKKNKLSIRS